MLDTFARALVREETYRGNSAIYLNPLEFAAWGLVIQLTCEEYPPGKFYTNKEWHPDKGMYARLTGSHDGFIMEDKHINYVKSTVYYSFNERGRILRGIYATIELLQDLSEAMVPNVLDIHEYMERWGVLESVQANADASIDDIWLPAHKPTEWRLTTHPEAYFTWRIIAVPYSEGLPNIIDPPPLPPSGDDPAPPPPPPDEPEGNDEPGEPEASPLPEFRYDPDFSPQPEPEPDEYEPVPGERFRVVLLHSNGNQYNGPLLDASELPYTYEENYGGDSNRVRMAFQSGYASFFFYSVTQDIWIEWEQGGRVEIPEFTPQI
jgi:hypothetical protein